MLNPKHILILTLVTSAGTGTVAAPDARTQDALTGLWAFQTSFGPAVRGELTVVRDGDLWRATVGGFEATSARLGLEVWLPFPGRLAQFRGTLRPDGSAIDGFWIQGRTGADRSGQPFATPMILERSGKGWRGTVRPLDDRFTLYLKIFRDADGTLLAVFRNPERNSNGGATRFRVARAGDEITFSAKRGENIPEIVHRATFSPASDSLKLDWPDADGPILLRRRAPETATGFLPRLPSARRYAYTRPPATGDGWPTARAREVGMDESALAGVVRKIAASDPSDARPVLMHSLLVARRGRLVLEEYFFGFDRDRPHDVRSAGKTFGSVMLGTLMMQGRPVGPETRIYELLAQRGPFGNRDARKLDITLAHLMTHTSGLACDDNDDTSPGNEGTMQSQQRQPDWWKYTLDLPMLHRPGTRYAYCSANTNLVGAALTVGSGAWLPQLFDETVARPLQFGTYHWNLMPDGEGYLGGGAYLRPRDLLKIGQAYLDRGLWQRRRIVRESWIETSTAPRMEISPETTGLSPEAFGEFYGRGWDGLAWHLSEVRSGDRSYSSYEASGNGGQLLIVVPQLEMVVVFTGGNYGQGGIWGRWRNEVVGAGIVPAIHDGGTARP